MTKHRYIVALSLLVSQSAHSESESAYVTCLRSSFSGNHNFTAKDVRSLCEEISGTKNPTYKWSGGPANSFTECFDTKKKELSSLGEEKASAVSKIVCRYESR